MTPSEPDADGPRRLAPDRPLIGELWVPGSKSWAQRALIAASLTGGTTRLAGLSAGEDVRAALALVRVVGATVDTLAPAALRIQGCPPGPHRGWTAGGVLEVGESGTLWRLTLAAAGLCGRLGERFELHRRGTLALRSSPALVECLRLHGVKGAGFPEGIEPCTPPSSIVLRHPSSSQEVSALLVALAAWPDEIELVVVGPIPSRPYVDLTLRVLTAVFGARVSEERSADAVCFRIDGPLCAPLEPLAIEADASLAAVALAAGCLSGGEVLVPGLAPDSAQGDVRILEHLQAFGCDARATERGFLARGRPSRAVSLDLSGEPDLAPVLAIVAADAAARVGEACELGGLGTLHGKESSRLEVLASGLCRTGWRVEASSDSLRIQPGRRAADPGTVLSAELDHRMAFAFALLTLIAPEVAVTGGQAVGKSWPSFWKEMARMQLRGEG